MDSIHKRQRYCLLICIFLIALIFCGNPSNVFADDKNKETRLTHIYEHELGISYPWLYGEWKVSYQDKKLGTVTGIAEVTSSASTGISIVLRHPGTSKDYYLRSEMVEILPDDYKPESVKIVFSGQSPPSGGDSSDNDSGQEDLFNAKRLAVPEKDKLKIQYEGEPVKKGGKRLKAERTSEVIDGRDLTVELKISSEKSQEILTGTWRHSCPESQIKYNRAGAGYEESTGRSKGPETWTRLPISIKSVTTDNARTLPLVWVLFEGENLPVEPKRRLDIEFEDKKLTFTGRYKTDPKDASKLYAQVEVAPGLAGNEKNLKLNDIDCIWDLGIPDEPQDIRFLRRFYEDVLYKVNELFLGEVFYFEAVYESEQLTGTVDYVITSKANEPLKVTLRKIPEDLKVMRSGPILLLDKDSGDFSKGDLQPLGPDGVAASVDHTIRSSKGKTLTAASFEDLKEYRGKKARGEESSYETAQVNVSYNQSLWEEALAKARDCKRKNPNLYTVSTRNLVDLFKKREIKIEVESHAAMLILRDELRVHVGNYYRSLFRRAGQEPAQWKKAWNEWQDYMLKRIDEGKPHVLFHFKVKRPAQVEGFRTEWYLSQALSCQRYFDDEESFKAYARKALAQAKRKLIDSAGKSVQQVRDAGDCDMEELMRLVGFGIDPVVNAVLPRLVRPPRGHEPRIPSVVPDVVARSYVKNLSTLAEAIRAQKHYSDLDTQFIMMAATVASAGLSTGGTALARGAAWASQAGRAAKAFRVASYISGYAGEAGFLAGDVYDVYQIAKDYEDRERAMRDLAFGQGTAELFGMDRWKAAESEVSDREFSLAMAVTLIGGPKLYTAAKSKGISPSVTSQRRVLDRVRSGVDPDDLSKIDRMTYDYMVGRAQKNLDNRGVYALSDEEWDLIDNYEVTVKARESRPPTGSEAMPDRTRAPPTTREGAKQASNLVDEHSEVFSDVARARDEIILTRPVNADSPGLIANDASTKNMHIKGKSSDWGPQKGYITVDQQYSKIHNTEDPVVRARDIGNSNREVQKCLDEGHAIKVPLKKDGKSVRIVQDRATGREQLVLYDDKGRYFDPDTGKTIPANKFNGPGKEMEVLADPVTRQPLTADYDLLATGSRKQPGEVKFDDNMGNITEDQIGTINDINKGVKLKGYKGGNVVHHGAENQYPKSPGADYPVTAYQADGDIVQIPRGPEGNPDKYLKEYFHEARQQGYHLDPNPVWDWGKYDPKTGWK